MKGKKFLCMLMATLTVGTAFAGCFGGGGSGSSDDGTRNDLTSEEKAGKTELKIGVYEGGYGYAWALEVAREFEALYADTSFEEGKEGVFVTVAHKKDEYLTLPESIDLGIETEDVYIASGSDFKKYMSLGVAQDMTNIMSKPVYDANGEVVVNGTGTQSILDRMNPDIKNLLNRGTEAAPKYYSLPYEWSLYGFVYDYELLGPSNMDILNYSGYQGTPKTTTEFFDMLDKIADAGYYGYTFSINDAQWYWTSFQHTTLAQYEGEAEAMLNLTLDGVATFDAGTFDAATCTAEGIAVDATTGEQSVTITDQNAWLLAYQNGKTKYVEFARQFINEKYYAPDVVNGQQTFSMAQNKYVSSLNTGTRIAMIHEGDWWENEAKATLNSMAQRNPNWGYGKRDFRLMPYPQFEGGKETDKYGFFSSGAGPCFISKRCTKVNVAEKFLQFMYSNTGCNLILKTNGLTLPMDFEIKSEYASSISKFAKSVHDLKQSDEVKIYTAHTEMNGVSDYSRNLANPMTGYGRFMASKPQTNENKPNEYATSFNPVQYFTNNASLTVETWMNGVARLYNKADWTAAYNKYKEDNPSYQG